MAVVMISKPLESPMTTHVRTVGFKVMEQVHERRKRADVLEKRIQQYQNKAKGEEVTPVSNGKLRGIYEEGLTCIDAEDESMGESGPATIVITEETMHCNLGTLAASATMFQP